MAQPAMEDHAILRHAIDLMDEGFALVGSMRQVVFCNRALLAMAGSRNVAGSSFDQLVMREVGFGAGSAHADDRFDARLARSDGTLLPVRVTLRPLRSVGGPAYCALVARRLPELEQALERKNHDLQRLSHQVLTVQETERKRIAADLHDCLGQSLSAVKFGLETMSAALCENHVDDARSIMTSVLSTVKDALSDVRRLAMNLRPSMLDDLGILCTLSWFTREFQGIYRDIEVETDFAVQEGEVEESLKVAIFRVVQEAMNNVAKHSRATRVRVSLRRDGARLRLAIEDDGVGFDPGEIAARCGEARRHGHTCARERVEWTGGRFDVATSPGGGVRLCATWDGPRTGADSSGAPPAHAMNNKHVPVAREAAHAGPVTDPDRRRPHPAAVGPAGAARAGS